MSSHPQIFVSIVAYQDPLLWWTIDQAYKSARYPERLVFAAIDQIVDSQRAQFEEKPWAKQVRYVHIHPRFARGPCWARAMAYTLHSNEPYLMQIDSHMWFEPNWDERLIDYLERISEAQGHTKHLITTYPEAFELTDDNVPVVRGEQTHPLVLRPAAGYALKPDDPVMVFAAERTQSLAPVSGSHLGAGCLFTRGHFFEHVVYDPWLYFHGEEQNLATRAWSHGWDIWHPPSMAMRHLYKGHRRTPSHWEPSEEGLHETRWDALAARSQNRMLALLYEQTDLGPYGLARERTLSEFAAFSGIDYAALTITPVVAKEAYAPPPPLPTMAGAFGYKSFADFAKAQGG
jgi:hypothetical protein